MDLSLIINKSSQDSTYELLERAGSISNLWNIYIEFSDYTAIMYQHSIFYHKNIYTAALHSSVLCHSVQPQNRNRILNSNSSHMD